ncbi:hypothetical protein B0H13DRAFT_1861543 [Mycena leptocephala]|nr:hypothetical protein B0H13DRAFT_1861543 [Mycena leptocephala]
MSSQRGRKRDTSLSPSIGLVAQRRFRARRAAHLQFNLPPANRPQLGRGPTGREKAKSTSRHSPPKYETLPIGPGRRISLLTVLFQPTSKFASYVTGGVAERPPLVHLIDGISPSASAAAVDHENEEVTEYPEWLDPSLHASGGDRRPKVLREKSRDWSNLHTIVFGVASEAGCEEVAPLGINGDKHGKEIEEGGEERGNFGGSLHVFRHRYNVRKLL